MGHYASEMGYPDGHEETLREIGHVIHELGFESVYLQGSRSFVKCPKCRCIVERSDAPKHLESHG